MEKPEHLCLELYEKNVLQNVGQNDIIIAKEIFAPLFVQYEHIKVLNKHYNYWIEHK